MCLLKKISILILVVITFSSCQDCLDCYGTSEISQQFKTSTVDTVISGNDTTFTTIYPTLIDSTYNGKRIGEFCDNSWKDYEGKTITEITTIGDSTSALGFTVITETTSWKCN